MWIIIIIIIIAAPLQLLTLDSLFTIGIQTTQLKQQSLDLYIAPSNIWQTLVME
jgi:hypothetical protein